MQPLRGDLARAFKKRGLYKEAQAAWVVAEANEVGKGRFLAKTFRGGELVCTSGSLAAAELQLDREKWLTAINKKLGQEMVRSIRFKQ